MYIHVKPIAIILAFLTLSACAHTSVGPGFVEDIARVDPKRFSCCTEPEKFYPDGLIRAAFNIAEDVGPAVTDKMYGDYQEGGYPGTLAGNKAAEAALMAQLQPLDLLFTGNKSYLWGHIIPGRFTHGVIYLGTEAQLRASGVWGRAGFAPLREHVRAGKLFIEATTPRVGTATPARMVEADGIAIVRPSLSARDRGRAYDRLAASLGVPYDFTFELATTDKMACTELINYAMPGLRLPPREAYGRTVIFPDEAVAQAIRGERMRVIGYMVGTAAGYDWRNTHSLMADIAAYWGVPGS